MSQRSDLFDGLKQGAAIGLAVLLVTVPASQVLRPAPIAQAQGAEAVRVLPVPVPVTLPLRATAARRADFKAALHSPDARLVADWVAASADNAGVPFAILDKREATVFVFDRSARLVGASPVLLGAAPGDDSVEGIGERAIPDVKPFERTTPAGRFVSRPGKNSSGEDVVWVDYSAAVSMHRVRLIDPKERRLERLASPDAAMRRISYGCINVPVKFFDAVVSPVLGTGRAVVYVLPETKSVHDVFLRAPTPRDGAPSMVRSTAPHTTG